MILVFVTNEKLGEVADLSFEGRVGYRNPRYVRGNDKPEKCDGVYIHGDFPNVRKLYGDKVIEPEYKRVIGSSKDYTISELRQMKADIDDWDEFTQGDPRKSIHSI